MRDLASPSLLEDPGYLGGAAAPHEARPAPAVHSFHSGLSLIVIDGVPLLPASTPALRRRLAAKRAFDVLFAASALVALAPVLLAVALAIRLTSAGPALFRQRREGTDGQPIEIFKFRSMFVDRGDAAGVAQTRRDDPRVTPVGRFIRRTSLDELPQLLNILRGEMSVVGPRPHPYGMRAGGTTYRRLVPYYGLRHRVVKPGLTGWAQVNGLRGPTDDPSLARARIDHDLAYIQGFSLRLDIRIVWLTVVREFLGGTGH